LAAQAKTRFVIMVDDARRELLSVREMPNSRSLTIAPRRGLQAGGEAFGPYANLVGQHFSVHSSLRTDGYTITQTVELAGGRRRKTSAFVRPQGQMFLWPIYGLRSPTLRAEHYKKTPHSKDDVVELGSFNPDFSTLLHFLVVTGKTTTPSILPMPPFNLTVRNFEAFDVLLFHTFMHSPSIQQGSFAAFVTSSGTWGKESPAFQIEGGAWSFSPSGLRTILHQGLEHLAMKHALQVMDLYGEEGKLLTQDQRDFLAISFATFSHLPFEQAMARTGARSG